MTVNVSATMPCTAWAPTETGLEVFILPGPDDGESAVHSAAQCIVQRSARSRRGEEKRGEERRGEEEMRGEVR